MLYLCTVKHVWHTFSMPAASVLHARVSVTMRQAVNMLPISQASQRPQASVRTAFIALHVGQNKLEP